MGIFASLLDSDLLVTGLAQAAGSATSSFEVTATPSLGGIATLSLGDHTSYAYSSSYTGSLSGTAIDIVPLGAPEATGIPSDGIDIHISSELGKEIDNVISTSCSGTDHNDCYHKISDLISTPDTDLQERQVGTLVVLGIWGLGMLIAAGALWLSQINKGHVPPSIHLPSAQISQASSISASSYSVVAVATSADPPFATITPKPTLTSSISITPAAVTTQSSDSGSHKQGDIVFSLSESQASSWFEIVSRANTSDCALADELPRPVRRGLYNPLIENVLCGAEMLLLNMNGGAAAGLAAALPLRFNWADPSTDSAMGIVQGYARMNAPELGVDPAIADREAIAAFIVAREVIVNNNNLVGDGTTPAPLYVAAADIDLAHPPASACEDKTLEVGFADCKQVGAIKMCNTRYGTTTSCVEAADLTVTTDRQLILTWKDVAWTVTDETPYPAPATPTPQPTPTDSTQHVNQGNLDCGRRTDQGNARYFVDLDMMNRAASFFCDQLRDEHFAWVPDEVPDDDKHKELHYNSNLGDPVYLSMDWINDPGCPPSDFLEKDTCMDRFGTIINQCDTSANGNWWWKQGGSFFRDCISYNMKRDDWVYSGLVDGRTGDAWRANTWTCNDDSDCSGMVPSICVGPSNGGVCRKNPDRTELGWCVCA